MSRPLAAVLLLALSGCGGGAASPTAATAPSSAASCPGAPPPLVASPDHPSILVQRGHAGIIQKVMLSDDGRRMVTFSGDGTLLVWDTASGLLLRRIVVGGNVLQATLSGDGDTLAYYAGEVSSAAGMAVFVVDLASGGAPRSTGAFANLVLSRDGRSLFKAGAMGERVELWDTRSVVKQKELTVKPGGIVLAAALDAAGKRLGLALRDELVVIDVASWTVEKRLPRPSTALGDTPIAVAFALDALVVRPAAGSLEIVPIAPGGRVPARTIPGRLLDFAVAGDRLWTLEGATPRPGGMPASRLTAWDPVTGAAVIQQDASRDLARMGVSAGGSTVALIDQPLGGRVLSLRDGATLRPLRTIDIKASSVGALAVDPAGARLAVSSTDREIARWDLQGGALLRGDGVSDGLDGEIAGYDATGAQLAMTRGGWVNIHEAAGGRLVRRWEVSRREWVKAAFLPGTSTLVTATHDGSVERWDLSGPVPAPLPRGDVRLGAHLDLEKPLSQPVASLGRSIDYVTPSPDGRFLALDTEDGPLGVVAADGGAVRWETVSPTRRVGFRSRWAAFTPDGARLLLSGREETPGHVEAVLRVFDAASGALVQTLHPGTAGPIAGRGSTLALGGFAPVMLDPQTLAARAPIDAFDAEISAAVMDPKRDRLILGGSGGTVAIVAPTGKAVALLLSSPGGEFVTATPEGAFLSSLDGARGVAWTFSGPLEGYTFEQLAARFERPDAVLRRLAGEAPAAVEPVVRPPRLTLAAAPPPSVATPSVTVRASVASAGRVDRVRAFVNGRGAAEQLVCAPSGEVELSIPLQAGSNRVTLVPYDAAGLAGTPRPFDVTSTSAGASRPELWVLAVGVGRYPRLGPEHQLEYATADARSIAAAFAAEAGPGRPFAAVHSTMLLDEEVTVESVERAAGALGAMAPGDLGVVFLAGHGVQLGGGRDDRMVFLTSGTALSAASARENGVGWDRIEAALGKARGRVLMLLDACHSGHISTDVVAANEALAQRLAGGGRAGVLVFAASRGSELSYEVPPGGGKRGASRGLELAWEGKSPPPARPADGGHGLFTGAVLEALAGGAPDRDHSGAVELDELTDFVTERVRVASNGRQTPWVARREMFGDFVIAPAGP